MFVTKKLAKNFKKKSLDTIICNVGGGKYNQKGFKEIKDYNKSLSTNFFSAINIIYYLKDKLKKNSKIIFIIFDNISFFLTKSSQKSFESITTLEFYGGAKPSPQKMFFVFLS